MSCGSMPGRSNDRGRKAHPLGLLGASSDVVVGGNVALGRTCGVRKKPSVLRTAWNIPGSGPAPHRASQAPEA